MPAIAQQDEVAEILGIGDFEVLFGTHPDRKLGLVDPRVLRGESAGATGVAG